jgi:hypothetical protein
LHGGIGHWLQRRPWHGLGDEWLNAGCCGLWYRGLWQGGWTASSLWNCGGRFEIHGGGQINFLVTHGCQWQQAQQGTAKQCVSTGSNRHE